MGWLRLILAAMPCAIAAPADACEATKAAYDRLRLGMTVDEASAVVGCAGELTFETQSVVLIQAYRWSGGGGSLYGYFHNGDLDSKSQSGLH